MEICIFVYIHVSRKRFTLGLNYESLKQVFWVRILPKSCCPLPHSSAKREGQSRILKNPSSMSLECQGTLITIICFLMFTMEWKMQIQSEETRTLQNITVAKSPPIKDATWCSCCKGSRCIRDKWPRNYLFMFRFWPSNLHDAPKMSNMQNHSAKIQHTWNEVFWLWFWEWFCETCICRVKIDFEWQIRIYVVFGTCQ